jgi:Na+/H+ antiporter NhaD/arsenite permease-like protein
MRRMPDIEAIGATLPLSWMLPFAGILLSIAFAPLLAPHLWHRHYPKIAAFWALVFAVPFVAGHGEVAWHALLHAALGDYLPFVILLWGLYTVAGGVVIGGSLRATPARNTGMLLLGAGLASLAGTTGASMLLIRPLLRSNAGRKHRVHVVVFFIFLVSNIGGALTPLGDPPLFLGFLHGVPFLWTLHLWPHLLMATAFLLALFYFIDRRCDRTQSAGGTPAEAPRATPDPIRLEGGINGAILLGILGAVLLSGVWHPGTVRILGIDAGIESLARDASILALGALSLAVTPRRLRIANGFSWGPMREVAILFAAIFATIIPAVLILKAGEAGAAAPLVRGVREPWQLFWATGGLSSFLDNAPAYMTFLNSLLGRFHAGLPEPASVLRLAAEQRLHLEAVAVGAVFMGANTYIGNAPNLMVKAIAEEAGVGMPSFFGYLLRWSVPILLPLFLLIGGLFF